MKRVVIFLALLVAACREPTPEECAVTVVEIGGCDRSQCAVRYSDGSRGSKNLPLIGDPKPILCPYPKEAQSNG